MPRNPGCLSSPSIAPRCKALPVGGACSEPPRRSGRQQLYTSENEQADVELSGDTYEPCRWLREVIEQVAGDAHGAPATQDAPADHLGVRRHQGVPRASRLLRMKARQIADHDALVQDGGRLLQAHP